MRCLECNKFASYEEFPEVDYDKEELQNNILNIRIRVSLSCSECGEQLREGYAELKEEICCPSCGEDTELELIEVELGWGEFYYQEVGKNRKVLKHPKLIGVGADIIVRIKCKSCSTTREEKTFEIIRQLYEDPANLENLEEVE